MEVPLQRAPKGKLAVQLRNAVKGQQEVLAREALNSRLSMGLRGRERPNRERSKARSPSSPLRRQSSPGAESSFKTVRHFSGKDNQPF